MKNKKTLITGLLVLLSVLCFMGALFFLFYDNPGLIRIEKNNNTETVDSISIPENVISDVNETKEDDDKIIAGDEPAVSLSEELNEEIDEPLSSEEESGPETVYEPERVENPYKGYFLENSDMIAWLIIPGTEIDFPVMWTPWDEQYYIYRGFDKQYSRIGLPFLDTDSYMYPSSTNLIIHGHNIKNQVFYYLLQYKDKSYCDEHPYIYLYGKDCEHIYEVMAVFRSEVFYQTDTCFKYYKFFQADNEEEFNDFYENVKALALYDTEVEAQFGDKFITLSTCSSHTKNGRFVVVAKEIEPGIYYKDLYETEALDETASERKGE